jgi:hypothetical protein
MIESQLSAVKLKLQVQKISFGSGRTGAETTIGRKELTACPNKIGR